MRLLLDTHIWIWAITEPERLPSITKDAIEEAQEVYLSVASVWEMSIKASLSKLQFEEPLDTFLPAQVLAHGMRILPISLAQALGVLSLPWHHKDPFDRLLISVAQTEQLTLVTADPLLRPYEASLLWAL